jgi:hypothetical protein
VVIKGSGKASLKTVLSLSLVSDDETIPTRAKIKIGLIRKNNQTSKNGLVFIL